MIKIKKIIILLSLILLASTVMADSVSSVTTTSTTSTATTGTNVVITSVSTSDSGTVTASQIQLSSSGSNTGSSFTISDPGSPYYYSNVPVTTTGVSKSFTLTAGTADTYTYQVTATWSGGSKSSTESTIQFVNPTALTITASPSSKTISQSSSFLYDISLQNAQSSNILTSYSLTSDANFTVTGSPTSSSGTTINSGSSKSLQWNITMSSCFTGSKTITFGLGDNSNAANVVVTSGNSTCTTTTSNSTSNSTSSSSGGGSSSTPAGTKITVQKGRATVSIPSIAASNSATVTFTNSNETGIKSLLIAIKNKVKNIVIDIIKLDGKPTSVIKEVTVTGKILQYVQIDKTNFTNDDLNSVTLNFQVPKTWIKDNKINESSIAMNRYNNNNWEKLVTTKTGEDSNNVFYDGVSAGFSVFAITGEPSASSAVVPTSGNNQSTGNNEINQTNQPNNNSGIQIALPQIKSDYIMIGVLVIIIIIALAVAWFKLNRQPKKYDYTKKKNS